MIAHTIEHHGVGNGLWTAHASKEEAVAYAEKAQTAAVTMNSDVQIEGYVTTRDHSGWHPINPKPVGAPFPLFPKEPEQEMA